MHKAALNEAAAAGLLLLAGWQDTCQQEGEQGLLLCNARGVADSPVWVLHKLHQQSIRCSADQCSKALEGYIKRRV